MNAVLADAAVGVAGVAAAVVVAKGGSIGRSRRIKRATMRRLVHPLAAHR